MSVQKTITIKNWYPFSFAIDPDAESNEITSIGLQIRRFTVDQGKAFNANWARVIDPPSGRLIYRMSSGDEQERVTRTIGKDETKKEIEVFLVDDDEIRRRRMQAMDDEVRAAFLLQAEQDRAFETDVLLAAVTDHMRVAPGQRVEFDSEDDTAVIVVQTGADLSRVFGGQRQQLIRLGQAIWAENNLGVTEKKVWRSLSASKPSSDGPAKEASGPRPAATVEPVASEASAATADAMALSATGPSGSIDR